MSQQKPSTFVSRVMAKLGRKPVETAAPVATAQAQAAAPSPKLTSDEMYNAITGGGRCLPG